MLDWTLPALNRDDIIAFLIILCYFAVPIGGLCWIALACLSSEPNDEDDEDNEDASSTDQEARTYAWAASGDGGGGD